MFKRKSSIVALSLATALTLAACGGNANGSGGNTPSKDPSTSSSEGTASAKDTPIEIAVFNGWDEAVAVSNLWKLVLESEGYTVNLTNGDPGAVYLGIADGDYDLTLDTWLPTTHADYMEQFGDDMVDLGSWNDEATLGLAVNSDAPITSLDELAANADKFDNRIVGIESGAGLTRITKDEVIPGYGLDKMEFLTSSTPAMLAELDAAMKAKENILVTLWKPHWAYDAYDIRDLEDPKGLLGDAESIHMMSRTGFADDFPDVANWISNFRMDSERLFELENLMFNEYDGSDYTPIITDWMKDNQDWVDSLTK